MPNPARSLLLRYGSALATVALTTGVRYALGPLMGQRQSFLCFDLAVLFTAWYGGFGPSVAAIFLSCLSAAYVYLPPHGLLHSSDPGDLVALGMFVAVSSAIVAFSEVNRATQRRLEREVADRKFAEEEARDSEDRFRQLSDTMPQIGWTAESDGSVRYFNKRWYEYTGLTPDESLAHEGWRAIVYPADLAGLYEIRNRAVRSGGWFETEARLRDGQGDYHWHLVRSVPVMDDSGRVLRRFGTATDIHDRKLAEQERQKFVSLARNSGEFIAMYDLQGMPFFVNDAGMRMVGLDSLEEAVRTPVKDFFFPEDQAFITGELFPRVIENGQGEVEIRFRHFRTGDALWMLYNVFALPDVEGHPCGLATVSRNITERRRLSEQLEEERNLLDALFASTPVGLGFVDAEFCFRRVNEATARTNGVPVEAHIGRTLAEVLPHLWPTLEPLYRRVLETGEPIRDLDVEGETPGCPGVPRSWLANYYPVRIGGSVVGVGFVIVETTEARKREFRLREAEQQLRERAKLLETVLAATPTPIWISHDRDCREITGNPASYRFLKMAEGGVVSATAPGDLPKTRNFREYRDDQPVDPRDLPMQVAARDGVEVHDAEFSVMFDDGGVRHLYGNAVPFRDEGGEVTGSIAAYVDITRLKEAEAALRDADRRKDEFLAMLAHELRNPLAPIHNAVSIMAIAQDDREAQQWSREVIERQIAHLTSLVDDLLDVSRITQGKITLTKVPLEVSSIIAAAVESSRPLIEARGHDLEQRLPEEPLWVDGDLTRLSQVVLNLLNNASKYTPEGGHIRLSVGRVGDLCHISVRDDGEGIAPETLPTVFGLFAQASRSPDRSQGGLGVGLTLVKRLVEMHGGAVEGRSDGPGKGSEFVVDLPLLRAAPSQVEPAAALASPGSSLGCTRRILIVDDSTDTTDTLKRLLCRLGHEVEVAHDGTMAIREAVRCTPELVLLDIGLPGMDGYEVAQRLRREPALDGIFLVALTGYGSEADRQRSTAAGFDDHLVKPVELNALLQVLRRRQARKL